MGFRYLLKIKLLPTFSHISIVVLAHLGTFSYNGSHISNAFLPVRASEQGNVIGSVHIYICVQKKFVIERTRDLIYLKFVAKDFFPKIISFSAGENAGDSV